jgi:hypothetical protein
VKDLDDCAALQLQFELEVSVGLAQPVALVAKLVGPSLRRDELGLERDDALAKRVLIEGDSVVEHAFSS